ncbi:Hca operon transcriptional activator HcaR [Burkholderiales bacterium 8X]|nr:Hca operon transcriptional activator HcaR [Burkholderiales bacterium 8X]
MKEAVIDLRVWRQFVAVAEALHFGRAAARLHMTQPPLTQAIAGLERTLGTQLFDRSRRRVALTPAGEAVLPEARELLARAQLIPGRARAAAAGELGRVRLAFVSTIGFRELPRWVRDFRLQCPEVALELVEATGDVQLEAFARGDIDAGLMLHSPGSAPPGLERLAVQQEALVLALPASHPLASLDRVPLAAALEEPLVIFPRRIVPSLHDAVLGLYHAAGRSPRIAQEAIQMQTIVNLVWGGLGIAWVPESVTQYQREGIVYRSADEFEGVAEAVRHPRRRAKASAGSAAGPGEAGTSTRPTLPACETSLVWPAERDNPALQRWTRFVRDDLRAPATAVRPDGPTA